MWSNRSLSIVLLAAGVSCSPRAGAVAGEETPPVADPATAATPAVSSLESEAVAPVLKHYEEIRAQLAADDADVSSSSKALVEAVGAVEPGDGPAASELPAIARAAEALAGVSPDDIAVMRAKFGELSRAVVALLTAHSELRSGQHLFECPMAEGYQRWVQSSEKLANPYMGTAMLECGGKVAWSS